MAKKGKMLQIWIDYRILACTGIVIISGLLMFLIISALVSNSRIDKQLEIGADIVCDIYATEFRDDSRESRRKDSQRDELLSWLENQGYGEQAREFLKQCEDSSPVE